MISVTSISPLMVAIIGTITASLLAVIGYFFRRWVIDRDKTNVSVEIEDFKQEIPLAGPLPSFNKQAVYCENVSFTLVIRHNSKGKQPVALKRVAFEGKPVECSSKTNIQLSYELNTQAFQGEGIRPRRQYEFLLEGKQILAQYRDPDEGLLDVDLENIFRSTKGTVDVTIVPEGDFYRYPITVYLETLSAGLYKARLRVFYDRAGKEREKETPWVYVFMKEPNHAIES